MKKSKIEKERKKEKKETRKKARADKKEERKSARADKKQKRQEKKEEKKSIRAEKKAAKKELRNSDLSRKEKKEAKKKLRQETRDDLKNANKEFKAEKKEIREDKKDAIKEINATKREKLDELNIPKSINKQWVSYLRFQTVNADKVYKPRTLTHIQSLCRIATEEGMRVKAVGSGHSFSEILQTDGILLETSGFNKMLPMSQNRRSAFKPGARNLHLSEIEAGMKIIDISKALEKEGRALSNQGTYDGQTLWGAISTSTHGSGIDRGPFPSMVRSFVLVGEGGRTYRIEKSDGITNPAGWSENGVDELIQNDKVFNAAVCSFGSMGVVYSVIIETRDFYWLDEWSFISTWETFKESFSDFNALQIFLRRWDTISILVSPTKARSGRKDGVRFEGQNPISITLRRSTLERRKIGGTFIDSLSKFFEDINIIHGKSPAEGRKKTFSDILPGDAWIAKKAVRATGKKGWLGEEINVDEIPIKRRNKCYKIFPKGGKLFGGYGTELAFPIERTIEIMDWIIELAEQNREENLYHTAPVAVRFVAPTTAYASPQYANPNDKMSEFDNGTVMFEVLMAKGTHEGVSTLKDIERDMLSDQDIRLHWGLNMDIINSDNYPLTEKYPKWNEFVEVYRRFNSRGTFSNRFTERIGL